MAIKKTVAIIGASQKIGTQVTKKLVKENYRLLLFDKDVQHLNDLVREIYQQDQFADMEMMNCITDAGWEADIIIVAVNIHQENEIAQKIKQVATGKVVISISDGTVNDCGEALQKFLPYTQIIKTTDTENIEEILVRAVANI